MVGLPTPIPCCPWLSGRPQEPLQGRGEGGSDGRRGKVTTATYMVPCLLDLSEKESAGKTIQGVNHLLPDQQECNPETRAEAQTIWEMGPANGKRTETARGFRKQALLWGCEAPNTEPGQQRRLGDLRPQLRRQLGPARDRHMPGTVLPKPACIPVTAWDHRPGVSLAPQVPDPVLSPHQPLRTRE